MSWADASPRRVVDVDLTSGRARETRCAPADVAAYLGGRGLAARRLADRQVWDREPLGADALLVLASGLLNGTGWPAASRVQFAFRSPLTEVYGYANAGGSLGPRLAAHDIAVLEIAGRAARPSVLVIGTSGVRLLDAPDLWGRETSETTMRLRGQYPQSAVACIGPAGERLVPLAAVIVDGERAAARCGGGAVLGSKNLKAIVVEEGGGRRVPSAFRVLARAATAKILAAPGVADLSRWGTPFLVAIKNERGDLPAANHRRGSVSFVRQIDADALEAYRTESAGCPGCPIRCGRISEVRGGRYQSRSAGPEYETIDALGPNCLCGDAEALLYANARCNELGLDTISVGATIAFALECREHGLLNDPALGAGWGDAGAVAGLIDEIARREGMGALLALGTRAAAAALGDAALPYALHVKGLEIPGQEPRVAKSFGLGHATSNRGADHLYALPTIDVAHLDAAAKRHLASVYPDVLDPGDEASKPALVRFSEEYCAASDALGVCKFTTAELYALDPQDLADAVCVLGGALGAGQLLEAGERIVNLERLMNAACGLDARADNLPARFTDEPLAVSHGQTETVHEMDSLPAMLRGYYALRGWGEDGLPRAETLTRLGLSNWRGR